MKRAAVALVLVGLFFALPSAADEGMYPISEITKLNLRAKGLEINPADDIIQPDGVNEQPLRPLDDLFSLRQE